jgi:hypothetical protein
MLQQHAPAPELGTANSLFALGAQQIGGGAAGKAID